jgi:hypothetical protein
MMAEGVPMSTKAIELVETRRGCEICEDTPRYDIMLHGSKVGQLYFNMRGYVGNLPTPDGTNLYMPESGISAFRRQVTILNKEFAASSAQPQTAA